MKIKLKKSLNGSMIVMAVIPLLMFGIFITVYCYKRFTHTIQVEVADNLNNMCAVMGAWYDEDFPGDYVLQVEEGNVLTLTKGGVDITNAFEIMDRMKEQTGNDLSLLFYDTRILTTLRDENGDRITGTVVNSKVLRDVYEEDQDCFYTNVDVQGVSYFAYYKPLFNEDGTCVGMLFAGKPAQKVDDMIRRNVLPIMLVVLMAVLVSSFVVLCFTKKLVDAIMRMEHFLGNVSRGEFTEGIGMDILGREDEIGSMARAAVLMQKNLCDLVDRDALTGLYNRRYGNQQLSKMEERAIRRERIFTAAIGDIDFFKKVNDTYGHEAGDAVLKNVAARLSQCAEGKGMAIRWGGEEFLLIFETQRPAEALACLERIVEQVRGMVTTYDGRDIRVTMTFGVMQVSKETDITDLIRQADDKLYYGKENGRNQIVTILPAGAGQK